MASQMSFNMDPDNIRSITEDIHAAIGAVEQKIDDSDAHVKTRHEGYGIVAQIFSSLDGAVKSARKDMQQYLSVLPTSDKAAIEAVSALQMSAAAVAVLSVELSAWSQKISEDLYHDAGEELTPVEQWLNSRTEEDKSMEEFENTESEPSEIIGSEDDGEGIADTEDVLGADE